MSVDCHHLPPVEVLVGLFLEGTPFYYGSNAIWAAQTLVLRLVLFNSNLFSPNAVPDRILSMPFLPQATRPYQVIIPQSFVILDPGVM